jgi:hypothetical protein
MADKRIPAAAIREAWMDATLTSAEAATKVGLSRSNLWKRAKAMGLPPRPTGRRPATDEALLAAMWSAGILARDIATHFGCNVLTVSQTARRLGLALRHQGGPRTAVRLSVWLAHRRMEAMARAMREAARETDGALKVAEMVDRKSSKVTPVLALPVPGPDDRRAA